MVLMFSPHLARHLIISAEIQRMITLNIIKCMAKLESRFEARMSLIRKFAISTICRYFENDLNLNRKFPEKIHRVKKKTIRDLFWLILLSSSLFRSGSDKYWIIPQVLFPACHNSSDYRTWCNYNASLLCDCARAILFRFRFDYLFPLSWIGFALRCYALFVILNGILYSL